MLKLSFIINPKAGDGTCVQTVVPLIKEEFPADRFEVHILQTEHAGHAEILAKESADAGMDMVVAVGGDGTVNEVARALVGRKEVCLGIVPMGSGNGLARHCGIPMNTQNAIRLLAQFHSEEIDCGDLNGHYFFVTAGTGYDAEVSHRFAELGNQEDWSNRIFGKRGVTNYIRAAVNLLPTYSPKSYHFVVGWDETFDEKAFLVTVGNADQWGNNAYITPQASLQDGLFTVAIAPPFSIIDVGPMTWELLHKQLDKDSRMHYIQTSHLELSSNEMGWSHVDGEPMLLESPLRFTIHPRSLRIITSPERANKL